MRIDLLRGDDDSAWQVIASVDLVKRCDDIHDEILNIVGTNHNLIVRNEHGAKGLLLDVNDGFSPDLTIPQVIGALSESKAGTEPGDMLYNGWLILNNVQYACEIFL